VQHAIDAEAHAPHVAARFQVDVRGALFVGVLQQPVDDVHDVLVVGIDVAGTAQLHQLLEAGQGAAGLAADIAARAAHRAGHAVELHRVAVQVQRVDHRQLDPAPGEVLEVAQPFLRQWLTGCHQHPFGVHRQRQEAVPACVGMGDQGGHRGHIDPGRIDPQVARAGARGQPFGEALEAQLAAAGGGQLEMGQQHQRMDLTGIACPLGGEADALQIAVGHQAVGDQCRGNLVEAKPARQQRGGGVRAGDE